MFFLGYGLIELPRELWRQGNYKLYLHRCQYDVHSMDMQRTKKRADSV